MRSGCLVLAFLVACAPRLELGASCGRSSDCPADLVCAFGRCRTECVAQADCPLGTFCRLDEAGQGTCALADDPTCPATPCDPSLACLDDECVNLCATVTECPPGSVCVASSDGRTRCARPELADAGGGDAGPECHGPACDPVVQVVAGARHACARTEGGRVWCWGDAPGAGGGARPLDSCEAGAECRTVPTIAVLDEAAEPAIEGATDVTAGESFSCVLVGDRPWCWGLESTTGTGTPNLLAARAVRAEGGGLVGAALDLSSSRSATFARMAKGELWAWGGDSAGALFGTPDDASLGHPIAPTPDALGATALAAGGYHVCALRGGVPWCWGHNDDGQLGRAIPAPIPAPSISATAGPVALDNATVISSGGSHACAIVGGEVWCWGKRWMLGVFEWTGTSACAEECSIDPVRVFRDASTPPFVALGSGAVASHECAIDEAGDVRCWGDFDARDELVLEPHPIELPGPATGVSVGEGFACAIVRGDVYCWGRNQDAQLGRGTWSSSRELIPERVAFPSE